MLKGSKSEQVLRVRVLEFVLERLYFYSPFAVSLDFAKIGDFPFLKAVDFETKSDALKSMISQS
jgi:hypothetical protein